jgi:hypothetical protein
VGTTTLRRKAKGLCTRCGKNPLKTEYLCLNCSIIQNGENKARRKQYGTLGKCPFCGQKNEGAFSSCEKCLEKRRDREKTILDSGFCLCGERLPLITKWECKNCWLGRKAYEHLGSRKRRKEIEDLFISQNYKCALTGDLLILGDGASIDHIIPPTKGGMENDINNLQALTLDANHFKWTKTNQEVILLCKKILKNNGDLS